MHDPLQRLPLSCLSSVLAGVSEMAQSMFEPQRAPLVSNLDLDLLISLADDKPESAAGPWSAWNQPEAPESDMDALLAAAEAAGACAAAEETLVAPLVPQTPMTMLAPHCFAHRFASIPTLAALVLKTGTVPVSKRAPSPEPLRASDSRLGQRPVAEDFVAGARPPSALYWSNTLKGEAPKAGQAGLGDERTLGLQLEASCHVFRFMARIAKAGICKSKSFECGMHDASHMFFAKLELLVSDESWIPETFAKLSASVCMTGSCQ